MDSYLPFVKVVRSGTCGEKSNRGHMEAIQRLGVDPIMVYKHSIPDYGDLMTVEEFREAVKIGAFTDYDGHGIAAKNGMCSRERHIYPSTVDQIPEDATHIVWFNK